MSSRICQFCSDLGVGWFWNCWICGGRTCREKARSLYQIESEEDDD